VLNLRRFFIYSSVVHVFFLAAVVLLIPPEKGVPEREEFFTRLVSPDELHLDKPTVIPPSVTPPSPRIPRSRLRERAPQRIPDRTHADSFKGKAFPDLSVSGQTGKPGQETEEIPATANSGRKQDKPGPPARDKLFDRGIIGDIAKRNLEREEKEKKDKTFTFDTKEYRYLIYNRRLKQRIESIWVYPRDAAAQGIYGDLVIRFTILKNGDLGSVELVRTSGHKSLDDAAIKALQDGAPYWPLPKEWAMEAYTIEGLFIYTLYGYYVL